MRRLGFATLASALTLAAATLVGCTSDDPGEDSVGDASAEQVKTDTDAVAEQVVPRLAGVLSAELPEMNAHFSICSGSTQYRYLGTGQFRGGYDAAPDDLTGQVAGALSEAGLETEVRDDQHVYGTSDEITVAVLLDPEARHPDGQGLYSLEITHDCVGLSEEERERAEGSGETDWTTYLSQG